MNNRLLLVSILAILPMACSPPPPNPDLPIVRQIDHIKIVSPDAPALFAFLADTLHLPVVWPLTDYGGFSSGGVAVGNVNLEIISTSEGASRVTGFALEPEPLDLVLPALRARGIRHGRPNPYRSRQPATGFETLWTTVALPEVSSDAVEVFFCAYTLDVAARRSRFQEELVARAGGPLGVVALREVGYGARDADLRHEAWGALLHPAEASPEGVWPLGAGPALRISPADADGLQYLVIEVASLDQARRFLAARGLVEDDRGDRFTLAGPLFEGLTLHLVEAR